MTFGLITEGISEYRIVKHIIEKYFRDEAPIINQIQPKLLNEKQETPGGWNEVLKYCERDELKDALVENDYLIIQIDTDQSETHPFSITHTKSGSTHKTVDELHSEVLHKIIGLIKPEIRETHKDKIFFAICIHSIECWLLPLYYDNKYKSDTLKCLDKLNAQLRRQNMKIIPSHSKNSYKGIRAYEEALKGWRRKADIINSSKHNAGFGKFIEALKTISV